MFQDYATQTYFAARQRHDPDTAETIVRKLLARKGQSEADAQQTAAGARTRVEIVRLDDPRLPSLAELRALLPSTVWHSLQLGAQTNAPSAIMEIAAGFRKDRGLFLAPDNPSLAGILKEIEDISRNKEGRQRAIARKRTVLEQVQRAAAGVAGLAQMIADMDREAPAVLAELPLSTMTEHFQRTIATLQHEIRRDEGDLRGDHAA